MYFFYATIIILILHSSFANAGIQDHLILKNDFNNDGIADRVVFSSNETSGFFQSTNKNQKIDTIYLRQGNRTLFFTSQSELGGPYIKLTENAGLYVVVSILKYNKKKFRHLSSFVLPTKTYFSVDPFASPTDEPELCSTNDAFNNKTVAQTISWADKATTALVENAVKKAIDPECKNVFGDEFPKLEQQLVSACTVGSGKEEKNKLVSCLDSDPETSIIGGKYKTELGALLFNDSFKISCQKSSSSKPLASIEPNSLNIKIMQITPSLKDRNFKADLFHEIMHYAGLTLEDAVEDLVSKCVTGKEKKVAADKKSNDKVRNYASAGALNQALAKKKDGIEVVLPANAKDVSPTSVASAVNEGAKTLDNDFSMDNPTQYNALSKVSKATFKSLEAIMAKAYSAAVPIAFAQNTVISANATASVALPTTKAVVAGSSRGIASAPSVSGATYDVSSLPDSVAPSAKGDLGNGMAIKASEVAFDARAPANSEVAASGATGGGSAGGSGSTRSIAGSLASIKTTERPDLRANVPQLKAQEDFRRTLAIGRYDEVKAMLVDPKNQRILEDMGIQYVGKDRRLGSKKPVIILKDLGNKFTVLRVNVE